MTDNNLISSDQIEGYPHPKVTETKALTKKEKLLDQVFE